MYKFATRVFIGAVLLGTMFGLTGCASVANGSHQQVPVISNPAGATVISDCGRGAKNAGETPVVVKVSRKADRCVITVKKEGYHDESIVLSRHVSAWVWGNVFLPYVAPGVLLDLYTGSAYRRAPGAVDVSLKQEMASR